MAKRASLSSDKAGVVLNLPPKEVPAATESVGSAMLDQIGHDTVTTQRIVEEVPLDRIRANPFQPRWAIDESTVSELVHSMGQRGFFGSLTARKQGRWYELAYGHQRLEAARRAGIKSLPLELRDLSDEEMLEYALSENLQRKDLSQLEEGEIFMRWQAELGRSERDIAERLGKSRGYVRNRLETARLPEDLKQLLREQSTTPPLRWDDATVPIDFDDGNLPPRFELSPAAAKELARIDDSEQRRRLTSEVLSRQLSFHQTKALVSRALQPQRPIHEPEPLAPLPKQEHLFGELIMRLEKEAMRVRPSKRPEAIRALDELIARAEQLRDTLKNMR